MNPSSIQVQDAFRSDWTQGRSDGPATTTVNWVFARINRNQIVDNNGRKWFESIDRRIE
jgi:hypothetical protein